MFAPIMAQIILIFLGLLVIIFGTPISKRKLERSVIENDVKSPKSYENAMFENSRAEPFDGMMEEKRDYDLQEDGNALTGDVDVIQMEDGHRSMKSAAPNSTIYRSLPMADQLADMQMPMAIKMPLGISKLIPMAVPEPVPFMVDHSMPIQRSMPLVIARPVPVAYSVGLAPKLSFPGYNGYGYPYSSGVRFARSNRSTY